MAEVKKETKGTEVVNYQAELAALTVATAEAEKPTGNWVSFKGGILTIGGTPMKNNKVEAVIIHSVFENQWYKERYDPNNPTPPHCYALGESDDDLKPHLESAEPQAPNCRDCAKNQWGSDPGGGKGKACKNVRRLAMISVTDLDLRRIPSAEVAVAKLPVTSVKNWATYASQIANVLKLPPLAVKTEVSVEPDAKTQFQVNFSLVDKIEDGTMLQQLLQKRKDTTPMIFSAYDKPTEAQTAPRKF